MSNNGFTAYLRDYGLVAGDLTVSELAAIQRKYEEDLRRMAKAKPLYEDWVLQDNERRMFAPLWEDLGHKTRLGFVKDFGL